MKYSLFLLALLHFSLTTNADNRRDVHEVIKKTSKTLNDLRSISYTSSREIHNLKDNYFSKNNGKSYFEYDTTAEGKVSRFQLQSEGSLQVYNGAEYFFLDQVEHTLEVERRSVKDMGNLSLLYNSITTLRIVLPLLLVDPTIPKALCDTLIGNKTYHLVAFSLRKASMEFPNGFNNFESDVTKYYKLVIDKISNLPYIIIDGNSISKDQYYTKTVFNDIQANPKSPEAGSWYFSSYQGYRQKQNVVRKSIIAPGSPMKNWRLPKYDSNQPDTINSTALQGKITLMEFWIKNCGYCMSAFPEIKELQRKYGDKLEIISINAYDNIEDIDFFYKRENPKYKMLYNGESLANELGIYAYPASILLDKNGKVIYSSSGFNKEKIEELIHGIL